MMVRREKSWKNYIALRCTALHCTALSLSADSCENGFMAHLWGTNEIQFMLIYNPLALQKCMIASMGQ